MSKNIPKILREVFQKIPSRALLVDIRYQSSSSQHGSKLLIDMILADGESYTIETKLKTEELIRSQFQDYSKVSFRWRLASEQKVVDTNASEVLQSVSIMKPRLTRGRVEKIIKQASRSVRKFPSWMRSDDTKRELERLDRENTVKTKKPKAVKSTPKKWAVAEHCPAAALPPVNMDGGLNDFAKKMSNMTPEQKEKWRADFVKKFNDKEAELERKRNSPPEMPTGVCVHCGGLVAAKHHQGYSIDSSMVPIGPGSAQYVIWKFDGYNCNDCGFMYKFAPPKKETCNYGECEDCADEELAALEETKFTNKVFPPISKTKGTRAVKNAHVGSSLESFFEERGELEEVQALAREKTKRGKRTVSIKKPATTKQVQEIFGVGVQKANEIKKLVDKVAGEPYVDDKILRAVETGKGVTVPGLIRLLVDSGDYPYTDSVKLRKMRESEIQDRVRHLVESGTLAFDKNMKLKIGQKFKLEQFGKPAKPATTKQVNKAYGTHVKLNTKSVKLMNKALEHKAVTDNEYDKIVRIVGVNDGILIRDLIRGLVDPNMNSVRLRDMREREIRKRVQYLVESGPLKFDRNMKLVIDLKVLDGK